MFYSNNYLTNIPYSEKMYIASLPLGGPGWVLLLLKRLDLILVSKEEVDVVIGIHQTVLLV